jgi:predicted kinase
MEIRITMLKVSRMFKAEEEPDLIILRGLPGSGKSTLAKTMTDRVHIETDQFFELGGDYKFDGSKIKQAHEWCQAQVRAALEAGKKVVVSNTFTQQWEFKAYIDMCLEMGKTYKVMEATGNYQNVHGVPDASVEKMKARWEPYAG